MSNSETVPFTDNWAYLKTELAWLERLLMTAIARQRQDAKTVAQVAQTAQDKVTSHWWKGLMTFNQPAAYDSCQPPRRATGSYGQQLEQRIQASQSQGVVLGLPGLQRQFRLSAFEKKLILLVLAPEVNRRFGRLYRYLQQSDDYVEDDLPTVDLCLRLLCRNDREWQQARSQLVAPNSLLAWGILEWATPGASTLLAQRLRLADAVTNYLLAEHPDPATIAHLVPTEIPLPKPPAWLRRETPQCPWSQVVLPPEPLDLLQVLGQQAAGGGQRLLLTGAPGTGKTTVARALATQLQCSLTVVDLEQLEEDETALAALEETADVVLLRGAHRWFGRQASLEKAVLCRWLQGCSAPLVCFSAVHPQSVLPSWRREWTAVALPLPDAIARRQLLRQALPADVVVESHLRWIQLARQLPLTGGELGSLVAAAVALARQEPEPVLRLGHFQRALALSHPQLRLLRSQRQTPSLTDQN